MGLTLFEFGGIEQEYRRWFRCCYVLELIATFDEAPKLAVAMSDAACHFFDISK